jgi:hypothetical protein
MSTAFSDDEVSEVEDIFETKIPTVNTPRTKPFKNSAQRDEWEWWNCTSKCSSEFCKDGWQCNIQKAIYDSDAVTMDIAVRMGFIANPNRQGWNCPEFLPKQGETNGSTKES